MAQLVNKPSPSHTSSSGRQRERLRMRASGPHPYPPRHHRQTRSKKRKPPALLPSSQAVSTSLAMATYLPGLNAPAAAAAAATATSRHAFSGSSSGSSRSAPHVVTCQASRRAASLGLGLAAVLLRQPDAARADDEPANNGWWLTEFPLPVPKILNSKPSVSVLQ